MENAYKKRIIPRRIPAQVSDDIFQKDLEKYRATAIELGATNAKIIKADLVIVQDRVLAKCTYPKCKSYGTSANCPPHSMSMEQMRKVVSEYRKALFIWMLVPSNMIANTDWSNSVHPFLMKMHEIVSKIEAQAFYDGYKLSLAFAGGPCKQIFCPNRECNALLPGQGCRHPLKARSAMEAVGIDVMGLAAKLGVEVYPIGASVQPRDVPHGVRFGIVFID